MANAGAKNEQTKAVSGFGELGGERVANPGGAATSAPTTPTGTSTNTTPHDTRNVKFSKTTEFEILLAQVDDCRSAGWKCGIKRVTHKGRSVVVITVWDVPIGMCQ